jgi:hypothetical protein
MTKNDNQKMLIQKRKQVALNNQPIQRATPLNAKPMPSNSRMARSSNDLAQSIRQENKMKAQSSSESNRLYRDQIIQNNMNNNPGQMQPKTEQEKKIEKLNELMRRQPSSSGFNDFDFFYNTGNEKKASRERELLEEAERKRKQAEELERQRELNRRKMANEGEKNRIDNICTIFFK